MNCRQIYIQVQAPEGGQVWQIPENYYLVSDAGEYLFDNLSLNQIVELNGQGFTASVGGTAINFELSNQPLSGVWGSCSQTATVQFNYYAYGYGVTHSIKVRHNLAILTNTSQLSGTASLFAQTPLTDLVINSGTSSFRYTIPYYNMDTQGPDIAFGNLFNAEASRISTTQSIIDQTFTLINLEHSRFATASVNLFSVSRRWETIINKEYLFPFERGFEGSTSPARIGSYSTIQRSLFDYTGFGADGGGTAISATSGWPYLVARAARTHPGIRAGDFIELNLHEQFAQKYQMGLTISSDGNDRLLLHFGGGQYKQGEFENDVQDSNSNWNIVDGSNFPGTISIDTSPENYFVGTSSLYVGGGKLEIDNPSNQAFFQSQFSSMGGFTIEAWIRGTGVVFGAYQDASNWWGLVVSKENVGFGGIKNGVWTVNFRTVNARIPNRSNTANLITLWTHIAVVRRNDFSGSKNDWLCFINGKRADIVFDTGLGQEGFNYDAPWNHITLQKAYVGSLLGNYAANFNGWIDELRITGEAKYVTDFVPYIN